MKRTFLAFAPAAFLLTSCGPEVAATHAAPAAADTTAAKGAVGDNALLLPIAPGSGALAGTNIAASTDLEFAGVLFSDLDAEVGARTTGVVAAVAVELSDVVREGQILARLDDARQLARLESATAARDLSRVDFERIDSLLARGFVTQAQHDEARYNLRVAQALLREAEVELEHTRIVAPFDGVITRRMAGTGRTAEQGDPLFRVTALTPLRALARVPEREAARIKRGSPAMITAETAEQANAIVARISPAVDPGSGTVEVLLDIARPGTLRPGAGVAVRFVSGAPPR